jgi:predicted Zn-dependent protease
VLSREEALQTARSALERSHADETEVVLLGRQCAFVRFAGGVPTQSGLREIVDLAVRARRGNRQGKATGSSIDPETVGRTVARAVASAEAAPEREGTLPLPGPGEYRPKEAFAPDSLAHSFAAKAAAIGIADEVARSRGLEASGCFETTAVSVTIVNSHGCVAHHDSTRASFSVTALAPDADGWAGAIHHDVARIDPRRVAERAAEKAVAARSPRSFEARPVRVILEPAAVANLLFFASVQGLGANAFEEHASFLSGRLGEEVLDPRITIEDDVYHPLHIGAPFDMEGVPKRAVVLVERGIARGVVHDRASAARAGVEPTGHALAQPSESGPLPLHLVLGAGEATTEEMIRGAKEAILVTRFHYVNLIDPMPLTLTGMTRSGTFLVRDGAIACAVTNLRFTESLVGALHRVVAVGAERELVEGFFGGDFVVPALALEGFTFTSATEF